jgi:mannose/cellobiose epimerase-like protein (N-acyl-D-glucosamine 2-epimerase family)
MTDSPDFRCRQTLLDHIQHTMAFYHPRCIDPSGGFFHFLKDDGRVYDHETRHLVSSTRYVFVYAMASRQFGDPAYREATRHGLAFLHNAHRRPESGGYAWQLRWRDGRAQISDGTQHCYGLAFVILAHAHALMAGLDEAATGLREAIALAEAHFWEPQHGLYADEANADWSALSPYRGQNANMHMCEALLAAYDATGDVQHLHRAETLARNITLRQAALAGGLVWEHYREDWSVDWEYNRNDRSNIFRPWGYQPGHLTEWAKLLLILERHGAQLAAPTDWLLPRARAMFDVAVSTSRDTTHGGLFYGFAPDRTPCDTDKYHWVQAETLAAAALLGHRAGEAAYWDWYDRMWAYCWAHFVDHRHGAWYRVLRADNRPIDDCKSPAGKTDYHDMGACYEVLNVLDR